MVALISHGHSWTVPTRRANNCCHAAHAAPFLADTVWQSHSLSSSVSAHAERNAHARLRSPCAFLSASSDEQRGGLGLCQTHDASAAIKPVPRRPEKGYASPLLPQHSLLVVLYTIVERESIEYYIYRIFDAVRAAAVHPIQAAGYCFLLVGVAVVVAADTRCEIGDGGARPRSEPSRERAQYRYIL